MRVLIADDDEVVLAALKGLLRHLGHDAVVARDGTQAWNLIQREDSPSLLILDWLMPGCTGIEICRWLRGDTQNQKPYKYVIMLTAKDEITDLLESVESGADDYLRKPFYGGEEFLAVLPGCSSQSAFQAAERIRDCVRVSPIRTAVGSIDLTLSIGVATMNEGGLSNWQGMVSSADKALYAAKRGGRDRVEVARQFEAV